MSAKSRFIKSLPFFLCSQMLFAMNPGESFVSEYLNKSASVQESKESLIKLENQVKQVRGSLFPQISASVSKTSFENIQGFTGSGDSYKASLDLTQPIYSGGKLFSAFDLAKAELASGELSLNIATETSKINAWKHIFKIVQYNENLKNAKDQLAIQNRNLTIVRKKTKFGNAKDFELSQARADLLSREIQFENQKILKKTLFNETISLVGKDSTDKIYQVLNSKKYGPQQISKHFSIIENNIDKMELQKVVKNNFDLNLIYLQEEALVHTQKIDLGEDRPTLAIVASQGFDSRTQENWFDSDSKSSTFTISASVPIFSGLSSIYKKRSHSADARTLALKKREALRVAKLSFETLKSDLRTQKSILIKNRAWLAEAKKSLDSATKSYKNGRINFVQLVQIQGAVDLASNQYWASWSSYLSNLLEYNYLLGEKIP